MSAETTLAPGVRARLAANLESVRGRIAKALRQAPSPGRPPRLVGVTKGQSLAATAALADLGVLDLGENRPLEGARKAALLAGRPIHWHMIGKYQTNKVRRTLAFFSLVHSVDSLRLLGALAEEAGRAGRRIPVLLEVNVSGEASKSGFTPEAVRAAVEAFLSSDRLRAGADIRGLMTMAPAGAPLSAQHRLFAATRRLLEASRSSGLPPEAQELSMGMSGDFEAAVIEGATLVRIGSLLFEGVAEA